MRRQDREMDREFALMVVDTCEYAVLSMVSSEGEPYCVPITIVRQGDHVYFHCAKAGEKIDCLRSHPQVCMACVGQTHRLTDRFTTEFESAILRGVAQEVTEDGEKVEALRLLCQRHTPTNMHAFDQAIERSLSRTAIWRIAMREITGKRKKYDSQGKEMKFGRME